MGECKCKICQDMCRSRPCWPSPEEAKVLLDLGYASKMMLDYWVGKTYTYIVSPACVGYEGQYAPEDPCQPCTLQTVDGLCSINEHKPMEGRIASCNGYSYDDELRTKIMFLTEPHRSIALLWNTLQGKKVVDTWKELRK